MPSPAAFPGALLAAFRGILHFQNLRLRVAHGGLDRMTRLALVSALITAPACEGAVEVGGDHLVVWPGGAAPCDGAEAEICNGRDDDCDGAVDEEGVCEDPCRPVMLAARAVLRADGAVFAWGVGYGPDWGRHEPPRYTLAPERPPLPEPATQLTAGCARTAAGQVHCWQWHPTFRQAPFALGGAGNSVAQVAQDVTSGLICARRMGPEEAGTVSCWDGYAQPPRQLPELGNDVAQVACGGLLGPCARKRDGSI
jgi:hypothetical protein